MVSRRKEGLQVGTVLSVEAYFRPRAVFRSSLRTAGPRPDACGASPEGVCSLRQIGAAVHLVSQSLVPKCGSCFVRMRLAWRSGSPIDKVRGRSATATDVTDVLKHTLARDSSDST